MESHRDLSAITLLALQVPTLRLMLVSDGNMLAQHVKLLKALENRPAHSRSLDMRMFGFRHRNDYIASADLLKIFNEKKLIRLTIRLSHDVSYEGSYKLLDKVLDTISKSVYLQELIFYLEEFTYEKEDWIQISHFMERLEKIAPTLVKPLRHVNFEFHGWYSIYLMNKITMSQERITKIMKLMKDKTLLVIDVLVGAVMFDKSQTNNPIRLLPIDALRDLREFLFVDEGA